MENKGEIWFSVVMPNYNKEMYIEQAIASVLNQDYNKFEVIVVDDGSTDESLKILKQINDKRVRVISQNNHGAAAARNRGIDEAEYPYIAFLDSDDIWLPWFLTEMEDLIERFPDAGAYGVGFLREKVTREGIESAQSERRMGKAFIVEDYCERVLNNMSGLTASSSVVRRETFERCGKFPVGISNWEDFDMWIRIGLYSQICLSDVICAIYNDVAGSASRNHKNLHAPVFDQYKEHIKRAGLTGARKKSFIRLTAEKECHAAYEQYLIDRKGKKALRRVLPFFRELAGEKNYWSILIQFVITPQRFYKINEARKRCLP